MRYVLAVCLCLVATFVQAEPFSVWEQDGNIWSMDDAIPGSEWRISRGENAHSPVIDGSLAMWIADWSTPSNLMGRDVESSVLGDWIIRIGHCSDPQVSYLGLPDEWAYVAWREGGGIWGRRLRDGNPPPVEFIPDYAGPYELDGRMLTWDGGVLEMDFPIPETPEPGTLVLLAFAALCIVGHIRNHRDR